MLRNYLLTAVKVFMRRKLYTAINLLCIVLTLVVLMVVTALLDTAFWPSGVEGKSHRFLQVYTLASTSRDGNTTNQNSLGYKTIDKALKPIPGLERVSAFTWPAGVSVYQGDRVSELLMRRVDADYWKILDFTVLAGRLPNEDDDRAARTVAVVNASTARRLFPAGPSGTGAPARAVGQSVSVGGQRFEIVGVVADTTHFNAYADMWAPLTTFPSTDYQRQLTGPFAAILLAKDASDLPRVKREVERAAAAFENDDPVTLPVNHLWADSKLDFMARNLVGNQRDADAGGARLLAFVGAAMLLFMLLPALNMVNLNTGRVIERSAEIGVRKAFGATSLQLAGQLIVENVLLCLVGGVLGLAGARLALWWLEASQLIPYLEVSFNATVFGIGLLIALVFGVLSGVIPAWKMSRLDPVHALKGAA